MNDTAEMLMTVLIVALWLSVFAWATSKIFEEARRYAAETRRGKPDHQGIPVTHQYPNGTERRIS